MKKKVRALSIFAIVMACAAMMTVIVASSKASTTTTLCHSTSLSISATVGKSITVQGSLGKKPQHVVKATLQTRLSTSSKWTNRSTVKFSGAKYSIKWAIPAKKGTYKVRVRISHLTASRMSATRAIKVK